MGGRRTLVALLVAAGTFHGPSAYAQTAPEHAKVEVALDYTAPGNCPTAAEFRKSVEGRTELAVFTDYAKGADLVQVTIRPTGTAYAGHLFMASARGPMSTRDVEDTRCADVADALALVTALAIDPNAALAPTPPLAAKAAPPQPPPPAPPSSPPMPAPAPPKVPAAAPPHPDDDVARPRPRVPLTWGWSAGGTSVVESGVAPDAMLGGGVFADLAADGPFVWAPSFRLLATVTTNGVFEARTAALTLVDARLRGCPLRFGTARLSIDPCAGVEVGALVVHGEGVTKPGSDVAPWAALDALARLHWQPWQRIFVELEGGVAFPLTRPTFVYDLPPVTVAAHPSAEAPLGALSAGVRFP